MNPYGTGSGIIPTPWWYWSHIFHAVKPTIAPFKAAAINGLGTQIGIVVAGITGNRPGRGRSPKDARPGSLVGGP